MSDDINPDMSLLARQQRRILAEMGSMRDDLAVLARLEAGQHETHEGVAQLRAEMAQLRADFLDELGDTQNLLAETRDDITVAMGSADAMQRANDNDNTRELVRIQGEQMSVMWRQLKALQDKVREITGGGSSDAP